MLDRTENDEDKAQGKTIKETFPHTYNAAFCPYICICPNSVSKTLKGSTILDDSCAGRRHTLNCVFPFRQC